MPVHVSETESALRQRLMAQLGSRQGSSAAAAGLAPAQPGSARAAPPGQAAAAASPALAHVPHNPAEIAQAPNGELGVISSTLMGLCEVEIRQGCAPACRQEEVCRDFFSLHTCTISSSKTLKAQASHQIPCS